MYLICHLQTLNCDVEETVHDDNDIAEHIQAAVAMSMTGCLRQERQYRGRTRGSKIFTRAPCSLFDDYLSDTPVYSRAKFRKVFYIHFRLYWALHAALLDEDASFAQQSDASVRLGHSSHQKILCCLHRFGSGLSFEQLDDMSRMSTESQRAYFQRFLVAVFRRFGPMFLNREPELEELRQVILKYEDSGFRG